MVKTSLIERKLPPKRCDRCALKLAVLKHGKCQRKLDTHYLINSGRGGQQGVSPLDYKIRLRAPAKDSHRF